MRFWLIDKIESFEKDQRLVAVKSVSADEDYLKDHFPEFPVLPGVFMLEAATQSAAWLLRLSDDFAHSVISLKTARNIKYADFVKPGKQLRVEVELTDKEDRLATFKVIGKVVDPDTNEENERASISGKIVVERFNLADTDPAMADSDARIRQYMRRWQAELVQPELLAAV